jgi:hypothetical protein
MNCVSGSSQSGTDNLYTALAQDFTVQKTVQGTDNAAISRSGSLKKAFPPLRVEVAEANALFLSGTSNILTEDGKNVALMPGLYVSTDNSFAADAITSVVTCVLNIAGAVLVSQSIIEGRTSIPMTICNSYHPTFLPIHRILVDCSQVSSLVTSDHSWKVSTLLKFLNHPRMMILV